VARPSVVRDSSNCISRPTQVRKPTHAQCAKKASRLLKNIMSTSNQLAVIHQRMTRRDFMNVNNVTDASLVGTF
jgi:hypothetical protein